jgi:hypothetical protein
VRYRIFPILLLVLASPAIAANWIYVTDDTLGMHYINPKKVQYKKRYGTAEFLLLTNLYIDGTKKLSDKSLITQYIIYCNPEPKFFNRYRMTSYTKPWGKGKVYDSFMVGTGSWQIEDGKEIEISEFVCKES